MERYSNIIPKISVSFIIALFVVLGILYTQDLHVIEEPDFNYRSERKNVL